MLNLNKIKWQAYMRLPGGGIYEKCKSRIKEKDASQLLELFNGSYLNISILKMYLFGYYSVNSQDIYNFYMRLLQLDCVHKIYKENSLYCKFDIGENGVTIKFPNVNNIQELSTFRFELLDLIFPYLIGEINNFNTLSFNEGPYEYISKKVNIKLKPEDVVFDLGANFGMFSAYAASRGCKVYAFEPFPDAINNYLLNLKEFYPNITVISSAVSDTQGYTTLSADSEDYGGAFINSTNGIKVPVTSIDMFVQENNIQKLDFIKADIEGSECKMLDGAFMTMRYLNPTLSLCKYHNLNDGIRIKRKILKANPNYIIDSNWKKIYAKVKE